MSRISNTPMRYALAFLFAILLGSLLLYSGCISMSETSKSSENQQAIAMADIKIPKDCPSNTYVPAVDEFVPVQMEPEVIYQPPLEYPKMAKTAGLQGKVVIQTLVCENGAALEVRVEKGSGVAALDEAALNQAHLIKYRPAIQDGHPVKIWVSYMVAFKLD